MSGEPTLQEILEVQALLKLPSPALVEKDFHVVRALRAITQADAGPLKLVFGGGTALGRAHRLLERMSEDIDLKIIGTEPLRRPDLRRLRGSLTDTLHAAGFEFDAGDERFLHSRNATRYTIFRLPYKAQTEGLAALRPEIQIEVAAWPLRREAIERPVSSFIAEAFKRPPEVAAIACVALTQTAAEKFVALTRRTAVELAAIGRDAEPGDIRHVYDLHMLRDQVDLAEVAALAAEVMPHDAEVFGNQLAAYNDDPLRETLRAIEALRADARFPQRYAEFCAAMVYGRSVEYAEAVATVTAIARHLPGGCLSEL